jgi:hypothetical protein
LVVECPHCGTSHEFSQPYPYHAGFGDTAFLYNEAGNRTLTWGTYDPSYAALLTPESDPWQPPTTVRRALEAQLPVSPAQDRWGFDYPARCRQCRNSLSGAMSAGEIYYYEYPDSVILGRAGLPSTLGEYLTSRPST